jgi:hypothetical protein
MHPELSWQLVLEQLEEARAEPGLFGDEVELVAAEKPCFDVRFTLPAAPPRLIRFNCNNYDYQPMDVYPIDLESKLPLSRASWVQRGGGEFPIHPATNMPFFCMPGVRQFYTFPGHDPLSTGQPWEMHRSEFQIRDMLRALAQRFAAGMWS